MKTYFLMLFIFAAMCGATLAAGPPAAPPKPPAQESAPQMSRAEFARRFAKIKEGMSADAVVALLGQPDDIRTDADPDGISLARTSEIWGYGVDHHLGFATRGSITIDTKGKVQYLAGTKGADELVEQLGEPELQRLLRLLADVPGLIGSFDPQKTIAAINALQPLGQKTGVALMREYFDLRIPYDDDINSGMFAVMRILFVPPTGGNAATQPGYQLVFPGYFREPGIAASDWRPADPRDFPCFPIALVDDIPLVITHGTGFGGAPETPAMHLDQLVEEKAVWRKEPLHPTADPLSIVAKIEARCPREQQDDPNHAQMIQLQVLRLLDSIYRPASVDDLSSDWWEPDLQNAAIATAIKKVGAMKLHWDAARAWYAREDGSILPPLVKPIYRRSIFAPKFKADPGFKMSAVLARASSKRMSLGYDLSSSPRNISPTELKVVQLGKPDKILFDKTDRESKDADHDVLSYGSSVGMGFTVPAGARLQIEITHGKEHFVSPVYEP
ncbi:MAG TPA: hypothetical protein VFE47_15380 [Tepidisphaeraceae bacterium]|jgi:hypothetical protein|nr:hypothetical protein [Tepidisphaeraceae bacterium]